jgi:hypothetical protein
MPDCSHSSQSSYDARCQRRTLERVARALRGEVSHRYAGGCPDPSQPESRDPLCLACKVLAEVERTLSR